MARMFSGRRARDRRDAAGVPVELAALTVQRSAYSVHEYEMGRVTPPTPVLAQLADLYGCTIDDFFEVVTADAVA